MFFTPIIDRRGLAELASDLGLPMKNVRRWIDSDSIPADWWKPIADSGVATLDELASAAEARRLAKATEGSEAAA